MNVGHGTLSYCCHSQPNPYNIQYPVSSKPALIQSSRNSMHFAHIINQFILIPRLKWFESLTLNVLFYCLLRCLFMFDFHSSYNEMTLLIERFSILIYHKWCSHCKSISCFIWIRTFDGHLVIVQVEWINVPNSFCHILKELSWAILVQLFIFLS